MNTITSFINLFFPGTKSTEFDVSIAGIFQSVVENPTRIVLTVEANYMLQLPSTNLGKGKSKKPACVCVGGGLSQTCAAR